MFEVILKEAYEKNLGFRDVMKAEAETKARDEYSTHLKGNRRGSSLSISSNDDLIDPNALNIIKPKGKRQTISLAPSQGNNLYGALHTGDLPELGYLKDGPKKKK